MSANPCPFVWYELLTTDPDAAAAFYCRVLGWTAADAGVDRAPYTIVAVGGIGVGGLMKLPADAAAQGLQPNWTGYVGVADVDTIAARVRAAGGKLHRPPQDIAGVGRFAVVGDPQGAVLCLFKGSLREPPPQLPPGTAGTFGWHELYADELDAAWRYHSALFGWTRADTVDLGEAGVYQLFAVGGTPIGGMMKRPPQVRAACWLYYVNVDAIDAALARVTHAGGRVVNGPMAVPGGQWIAQCADPQGAMFALVADRR